jgi:hypothetical protein
MTGDEVDYVFQCDYCGEHVAIDKARVSYLAAEDLQDGRVRVVPATFCGPFCATRGAYLVSSG